jgi:hypothetical protein
MACRHIPYLWRYRLLRDLRAKQRRPNYRLLHAWREAEGGTACFNPLNTTEPMPGATDYNSVGVKNYTSGAQGISATYLTLVNGHYDGIVHDMRGGSLSALEIVQRNAAEFDTWGTGAKLIEEVLRR